jgi:hypothetical protein
MFLTIGAWPNLARGVGIEPTKDGFGDLPVPSTPRLEPRNLILLKIDKTFSSF